MPPSLRQLAKSRAQFRCEYCRIGQATSVVSFHVEHIIPRQHGGVTSEENLALSCPHCNLHKGPNLAGMDPDTGEVTRLFHPRSDVWSEHFRLGNGQVTGLTAIGRTTVWLLTLTDDEQMALRSLG